MPTYDRGSSFSKSQGIHLPQTWNKDIHIRLKKVTSNKQYAWGRKSWEDTVFLTLLLYGQGGKDFHSSNFVFVTTTALTNLTEIFQFATAWFSVSITYKSRRICESRLCFFCAAALNQCPYISNFRLNIIPFLKGKACKRSCFRLKYKKAGWKN